MSEPQRKDESVDISNHETKAGYDQEVRGIMKIEGHGRKKVDANYLKEQADQQLALISEGTASVSMGQPEDDNSQERPTGAGAQRQLEHAGAVKLAGAHKADTSPTRAELPIQRGHTMASSPNRDSAKPQKVIEVRRHNEPRREQDGE